MNNLQEAMSRANAVDLDTGERFEGGRPVAAAPAQRPPAPPPAAAPDQAEMARQAQRDLESEQLMIFTNAQLDAVERHGRNRLTQADAAAILAMWRMGLQLGPAEIAPRLIEKPNPLVDAVRKAIDEQSDDAGQE